MEKHFSSQSAELQWIQRWKEARIFAPQGDGRPFSMMIPPPNITGRLHMGHALQYSLMDIFARFARQRGYRVLWQMGTDHAGIATQLMVERQLHKETGQRKEDIGREAFLERSYAWKDLHIGAIHSQIERIGASVDPSSSVFTMDSHMAEATYLAFERLYEEGLIYRGTRLVHWDPLLQTALSDLEVVHKEIQGKLYTLAYALKDGGEVLVETTRPETLFGDVALAVHPGDARFSALVGQSALVPIVNREIPIVADEAVDPDFGTGCLKITPAHDFNDAEVAQRHRLAAVEVLDAQARLTAPAPEEFVGLDRFEGRKLLLSKLRETGQLRGERAHTHAVPHSERSGVLIEPRLTAQWYVKVGSVSEPQSLAGLAHEMIAAKNLASDALRSGSDSGSSGVSFVPEEFENNFHAWMANLKDWCISRQLWWGHRIPVFYGPENEVYVGRDEAHARARAGLAQDVPLRPETDVLDTWFTSGLWAFAPLGWPDESPDSKERLALFYPNSLLVTGFDILFFWVVRMMMLSGKLLGRPPFYRVVFTGLIRDPKGEKMSKTKGNVIDPLDVIEGISREALIQKRKESANSPARALEIEKETKALFPEGIAAYGCDVLRLSLLRMSQGSREIRFDPEALKASRNFTNKLWNGARFAWMNLEGYRTRGPLALSEVLSAHPLHQWMHARMLSASEVMTQAFAGGQPHRAVDAFHALVWDEFCGVYLELCKVLLREPQRQAEAQRMLCEHLSVLLKLGHALLPFVTEEIHQALTERVGGASELLAASRWPFPEGGYPEADRAALSRAEVLIQQRVLLPAQALLQLRGKHKMAPSVRPAAYVEVESAEVCLEELGLSGLVCQLARLSELFWVAPRGGGESSLSQVFFEGLRVWLDALEGESSLAPGADFERAAPEGLIEKWRQMDPRQTPLEKE